MRIHYYDYVFHDEFLGSNIFISGPLYIKIIRKICMKYHLWCRWLFLYLLALEKEETSGKG